MIDGMDDGQKGQAVPFTRPFVASPAFRQLFNEGMDLVEQAAAYLDGAGREQAKALPRQVSLAYSTESMRLTSRVMQIASWLLIHRALADKDMTRDEAAMQRSRVRISDQEHVSGPELFAQLPEELREMIARSLRIQRRIQVLDSSGRTVPTTRNPVAVQQLLLRAVFESTP
jgi:regulator of CtrA degradation